MRIIVFGAAGFIGGWVCEELADRGDVEIQACVRRWTSAGRLARHGIDIKQCDLCDQADLKPLLSGADVVINATMPASDREPELVTRLYSACYEACVNRFIQFSSVAVYGDQEGSITEETGLDPDSDYARGKLEMESRLLELATDKNGPLVFILRPSLVYGPFSDAWTVRYAQRIARAGWKHLGRAGTGTCNLVHARDVARLCITAATARVPDRPHTLIVNGQDIVSWNEYIEGFGNELKTESDPKVPNYGYFLAKILWAAAIRNGGKLAKSHLNNVVTSISHSGPSGRTLLRSAKAVSDLYPSLDELRLLRRQARYSPERAERELGFRASVPLELGLQQSAEWCKLHGVV